MPRRRCSGTTVAGNRCTRRPVKNGRCNAHPIIHFPALSNERYGKKQEQMNGSKASTQTLRGVIVWLSTKATPDEVTAISAVASSL